jgi:hypothetical protein
MTQERVALDAVPERLAALVAGVAEWRGVLRPQVATDAATEAPTDAATDGS